MVNLRVTVTGPTPSLSLPEQGSGHEITPKGERQAWFDDGFKTAKVYDRYTLPAGCTIAGPAIVEEREATTIVAPGDVLRVDTAGTCASPSARPAQ